MAQGKRTGASDKVRACIAGGPVDRATVAERTKVDGETVSKIVYGGVQRGEWLDEEGTLSVNPDYVKGRWRAHATGKKLKGNRAVLREKRPRKKARPVRSMRELVNKHVPAPSGGLDHVRTTFEVVYAVLDMETAEPMLVKAMAAHREAIDLAVRG